MATQRITGTVQSGGPGNNVPLSGLHVTIYETTPGEPKLLGMTYPDPAGRFMLDVESPTGDGILYANAHVNPGVQMATVIGTEVTGPIVINEMTTVATGFAMAQFTRSSQIRGDGLALRIAAGMCENLASPATGEPSAVMCRSPNHDETNSLRSLGSLANLLVPCIRGDRGALATVLRLAQSPQGEPAWDTWDAIVNITRNPANNVGEIFSQAQTCDVYQPALAAGAVPDAWTLVVKVNHSGSLDRMFGGPANVAFDDRGYAWVANNVIQGGADSADCIMVLQPNGKPADGRDGTPTSPVVGGGIKGVGFGVTVAPGGHVWFGNFGWGQDPPKDGSVSEIDPSGRPVSPPEVGYINGTLHVQGTVADPDGNIWLASFGNDRVVVFPRGEPEHAVAYPPTLDGTPPGTGPFGIAIIRPGEAWVTYSGGLGWPDANTGLLCRYRLAGTAPDLTLELVSQMRLGEVTKGVALDSGGNVWVAAGGHKEDPKHPSDTNLVGDTVYMVSADGTKVTGFRGGGIDGPWSVAIDGDDHVWVANFGRMGVTSDYTNAGVTKLAGINPPAGLETGDPISPPSGYTLPTAGEPVRLANEELLYGRGTEPCYSPLMRMTSVIIDRAGNLWAVNNWKPNFATDFSPTSGNPGGDGICIFVGVAKPPRQG